MLVFIVASFKWHLVSHNSVADVLICILIILCGHEEYYCLLSFYSTFSCLCLICLPWSCILAFNMDVRNSPLSFHSTIREMRAMATELCRQRSRHNGRVQLLYPDIHTPDAPRCCTIFLSPLVFSFFKIKAQYLTIHMKSLTLF